MPQERSESEIRFLEMALLAALEEAAQCIDRAGQNAKNLGMSTDSLLNEYSRIAAGHSAFRGKIRRNREGRAFRVATEIIDNLNPEDVYGSGHAILMSEMVGDDFND